MGEKKQKKRINWLLILQGWAMLWVVIGHAFLGDAGKGPYYENYLFHFAYSFHMPLFMLVSGWLFFKTRLNFGGGKIWSYSEIVRDKTMRLLIPGFTFSVVAFFLKLFFSGAAARQVGLRFSDILHAYLYPIDNPFLELWFIVVLYSFFLFTPLWKMALNGKLSMWISLVLLIVVHLIHPSTKLLCVDRICGFAIWFYLGLVISKNDLVDKFVIKQPLGTMLIGLILYITGGYANPFITTTGGITMSFGLALLAEKYVPKLFNSFRNYTYQIFLMGIFAQIFVKLLYKNVLLPYILAYILCIVVGLYVPVLISKLIEKINWKPLSLCVGLK